MAVTAPQLAADLLAKWDTSRSREDQRSDKTERAVEVAAAMVCRYAPKAPDVVLREAIARTAGWLLDMPDASFSRLQRPGGLGEIEYMRGHLSALRHSGAMSMLSPWKVRRAGAV